MTAPETVTRAAFEELEAGNLRFREKLAKAMHAPSTDPDVLIAMGGTTWTALQEAAERADGFQRAARNMNAERARLFDIADRLIGQFENGQSTHPGEPCKQTGHTPERVIRQWREELRRPMPDDVATPEPANGWLFALSPNGKRVAFYDPGNGPWFIPRLTGSGSFVTQPEIKDWTIFTPRDERTLPAPPPAEVPPGSTRFPVYPPLPDGLTLMSVEADDDDELDRQLDAWAAERAAGAPPEHARSFVELMDTGLLWLINEEVFHPRGRALGFHRLGGHPVGWSLLGDGTEPWSWSPQDRAICLPKVTAELGGSLTKLVDRHNPRSGVDGSRVEWFVADCADCDWTADGTAGAIAQWTADHAANPDRPKEDRGPTTATTARTSTVGASETITEPLVTGHDHTEWLSPDGRWAVHIVPADAKFARARDAGLEVLRKYLEDVDTVYFDPEFPRPVTDVAIEYLTYHRRGSEQANAVLGRVHEVLGDAGYSGTRGDLAATLGTVLGDLKYAKERLAEVARAVHPQTEGA